MLADFQDPALPGGLLHTGMTEKTRYLVLRCGQQ
jgi:hypothetical protein